MKFKVNLQVGTIKGFLLQFLECEEMFNELSLYSLQNTAIEEQLVIFNFDNLQQFPLLKLESDHPL